jgi:hypothetical protein
MKERRKATLQEYTQYRDSVMAKPISKDDDPVGINSLRKFVLNSPTVASFIHSIGSERSSTCS